LLECLYLLIGWSDEDGENIPKIYQTRRIHWSHLDKVILSDSSLIFVFKLVVLIARGVVSDIYTMKLVRRSSGAPYGAFQLHSERASTQADANDTLEHRSHAQRCCGRTRLLAAENSR
jgi:hypothetical protein